jgi:hypothetical protein
MLALFLLALASLVSAQTRGNAFVGCYAQTPTASETSGSTTSVFSAGECAVSYDFNLDVVTRRISRLTIQTFCANGFTLSAGTIAYSFYYANPSGSFGSLCSCTTSQAYSPMANKAVTSRTDTIDQCHSAQSASVYRLGTTFNSGICLLPLSSSSGTTSIRTTNLDECFSTCRYFTNLIVDPNLSDNTYICTCAPDTATFGPSPPTTECNPAGGAVFRFRHSISAASAGFNRKRRRRVFGVDEQFCPAGLTACKVGTGIEGYEVCTLVLA